MASLVRVLVPWLILSVVAPAQQPRVLTGRLPGAAVAPGAGMAASAPDACAALAARAWHGQPVPGGGTLSPVAFVNPATAGLGGRVAFFAQVDGSPRNQGIFTADAAGLHVVAMGCGGGGGSGAPGACGDPSPVGGTFAGFFGGTFFAPAVNAGGDVLFMADILGGSTTRGLFLYQAASGTIVKVAALGDASPLGGSFTQVGPGSLSDGGVAVFLAKTGASSAVNIFRWQAGVTSKVAAVGDAAPGGGTFAQLGTESLGFVDGTTIPVGPLPAINAAGQVAFRAVVGGQQRLIVSTAGVHALYLRSTDATPAGGTYAGFQAPHLNAWGEIAFFADYQPTPGNFSSGLFAGRPGAWRKAVAFYDLLPDGGQCWGLAFSRNPMTPLDDAGNYLVWVTSKLPGGAEVEQLLASRADGGLEVLAAEGDPTPLGGTLGFFQAWPSMRDGQVAASATTPGAPGVFSAHFALSGALTWDDRGHALAGTAGLPRLAGEGSLQPGSPGALRLSGARPLATTWLLAGFDEADQPFKGGVLVPTVDAPPLVLATDAAGALSLPWAAWPAGLPACSTLVFQAWVVDPAGPKGAAASNGLLAITP